MLLYNILLSVAIPEGKKPRKLELTNPLIIHDKLQYVTK